MGASNSTEKSEIFPSKKVYHKEERLAPRFTETEPESATYNKAFVEIRFDYKTNLFLAVLALYLLVATCFNINGSSVGMWNEVFYHNPQSDIHLGTPKQIRSDEWAFHTPAILSQCNSIPPFPAENYSLGGHKAPLVMSVPAKHFSILLRPQFWLFFLVSTERAFAFYWSMKLVFLMGGIFFLLMMILENNFVISLFGALWVYFSGYMQWWYSSPAMWPELVGCFALFTTTLIQILVSKRKVIIVLSSLIFLISFFNFVVTLYPPHQVPLVYLSCCIIIGVLSTRFRSVLSQLLMDRFRLTFVVLTLVFTAGLLFLFYCDTKYTLKVFVDTVYPGMRRSTGGEISIAKIFNGFFGIFMSERNFPRIWGNVCESSNFFLLFPVPMMLFGWEWLRQKKVSALNAGFALYIAIILLWLIWGFPKPVAQVTLFDRVPGARSVLSLGIASIIWTCLSLHRITRENTVYTLKFKISVTAIMFIGVLIYAFYFNVVTESFASVSQIIIACAFVTVASFLLLGRKALLFAGLILIPNIMVHSMVNPICIGLKPILSHPLYERINHIVRQAPDSKWIVYRTPNMTMPLLANFTYAGGAKVFNGLKYIPNLDEMKELSSKDNDIEIYNRYGYISLSPVTGSEVSFGLLEGDLYMISVDPGNDCWKRLGITYCLLPSVGTIYFHRYPEP